MFVDMVLKQTVSLCEDIYDIRHNINSIIHNCFGLLLFLYFHRVNAI